MEGFFSKKETESISRPDGKTYSCISCGLYKDCKSPKLNPFGNFKKKILIIGEAPGVEDDREGKPWQGKTGRLLQSSLRNIGIDLFEDCLTTYAIKCRPTDEDNNDRTPVNYEIECCRKITLKIIEENKPKVIILLGISAVFALIGHRWKKDFGNIYKWRGWTIPDQDLNAWLIPTFDPDFVYHSDKDNGVAKVIWEQDLAQAIQFGGPPPKFRQPQIEIITDLRVLDTIKIDDPIVPDFETTGKKPHAQGHKIVCIAIADAPSHCFVFMIPESRSERKPLYNLFSNPDIPKWGQNIKFEETWSEVIFRQKILGWQWDTMLTSHILDNRAGVTGLKFQTYVQFGVIDYSSEIEPYLKSVDEDNANAFNRIMELIALPGGKEKLMKYCGLDTIFTYLLSEKQMDVTNFNYLPF